MASIEVQVDAPGGSGSDRVAFDGDGLTDTYERRLTGTDPLDPDSDSSATDANEADDGVVDGAEDFDGDSIDSFRERQHGTDPLDPDTDGDGLTDGFERLIAGADPLVADTDGDGTPDGEEDLDGDGLTNVEEGRHGSDPNRVDGDNDGLSDPEEIELGTDPLLPDTDDDWLLDGRELEAPFHTDPRDPDTDDDGVLDGEETYTTAVENPSLGVTVGVTGTGDLGRAVAIEPDENAFLDSAGTQAARLSPMIEIRSSRPFDRMSITIEYDPTDVGDPADVAVFRFDRRIRTFVRLESTVYPREREVTATATTDGTYVAFNSTTWAALFAEPLPEPGRSIEIDEDDVTCEGSGQCGVEDGAIYVGEPPPDRSTEPTPTETATPPKSRVVWNNRSANDGGSVESDDEVRTAGPRARTATPHGRGAGGSIGGFIDGFVSWIDSWLPG